jgi:hypothetical protein
VTDLVAACLSERRTITLHLARGEARGGKKKGPPKGPFATASTCPLLAGAIVRFELVEALQTADGP